jgi:hypothetical protein
MGSEIFEISTSFCLQSLFDVHNGKIHGNPFTWYVKREWCPPAQSLVPIIGKDGLLNSAAAAHSWLQNVTARTALPAPGAGSGCTRLVLRINTKSLHFHKIHSYAVISLYVDKNKLCRHRNMPNCAAESAMVSTDYLFQWIWTSLKRSPNRFSHMAAASIDLFKAKIRYPGWKMALRRMHQIVCIKEF